MRIQFAFALILASYAQAQPGCPGVRFETAVSANMQPSAASHVVLLREDDGSYTAYEITNASPYRLVRKTPNFQKQLTACLPSHSSLPPLPAPTGPGNPPGATARTEAFARLSSGGYLFAAVENYITAGIRVVLFDSDLNFVSEVLYPVLTVRSLTLADLNGDGNPDIIALRAQYVGTLQAPRPDTTTVVDILLGIGGTGFQPPTEYALPDSPASIAVADTNGDHRPDLIVASTSFIGSIPSQNSVSLFIGSGDGTFQAPRTIFTGLNRDIIWAIAIADLNGDGKADIAFTFTDELNNTTLAVALQIGNANFAAPSLYSAGGFLSLAVGDVDGDGIPDIVTSGVSLLFGDGKGAFPRRKDYLVKGNGGVILADIDGDGRMDIVLGEGNPLSLTANEPLAVLFGWDTSTFFGPQVSRVPSVIVPIELAAADFNDDGVADLAYRHDNVISILKGAGEGSFTPGFEYRFEPSSYPNGIAIADFNHDGQLDLALTTGSPSSVAVLLGKGDGTFHAPLLTAAPAGIGELVAGDFNGDGKLDVAVVERGGNYGPQDAILIFLGHGDGTFATPVAYQAGLPAASIALGDCNGDGKLDLVFTSAGSQIDAAQAGSVSILLGKGDGTFTAGTSFPLQFTSGPGGGPGQVSIADFNRDGKLDLAITPNGGQPGLAVLLGRGDGTFQESVIYPVDTQSLAIADINGDKVPDLIAAGVDVTGYLLGNGDGTFRPEVSVASQTGPVIAADVNGDGKPDLAFLGVATFLNVSQSPSSFAVVSAASLTEGPLAPESLATAFGQSAARSTVSAGAGSWPTTLSNTTVSVQDAASGTRLAQLLYVSPQQVNFLVPAGTSAGMATVTVTTESLAMHVTASTQVQIALVAPSLFTVNVGGLAAGYLVRTAPDKRDSTESIFTTSQDGSPAALPVDLGPASEQVHLILYGTGIRNAGAAGVTVNIDGLNAPVAQAGPETTVQGLDQVDVLLPPALAGSGDVSIVLAAAGITANTVHITIK